MINFALSPVVEIVQIQPVLDVLLLQLLLLREAQLLENGHAVRVALVWIMLV